MSIGAFGDRFAKIAEAYGASVDRVSAEWGWAAAPDEVRERLGMGDYRAVLLTHNETSTGVMNPIPELAAAIREEAPDILILVDTVSSLGAVPFDMDGWGVDVVATASQKAWMAAPGLAMVAGSERAREAMKTARMPRFYLDLQKHLEAMASGIACVATRVGGVPEVLDHDDAGVLVEPADPSALAQALEKLLGEEPLRVMYAHAARRRAQSFDIKRAVRQLERLYDEVTESC